MASSWQAYRFGNLAERIRLTRLLTWGLLVLLTADLAPASSSYWAVVIAGVALWADDRADRDKGKNSQSKRWQNGSLFSTSIGQLAH